MKHIIALLASLACSFVYAQATPTPLPTDTRLVVFAFDENNTYQVLTRPSYLTNIQLGPDEKFVHLVIGDTVSWVADQSKFGNLFIRPKFPNIQTSATIVTTKRTYQLILKGGSETDKWYQRVTWEYPNSLKSEDYDLVDLSQPIAPVRATANQQSAYLASDSTPPGSNRTVALDNLNFEYTVKGRAPFAPVQTFDDGRFTWIKMPKMLQDLPAVFARNTDGSVELVNYTIDGDYVVVQKIAPSILLKLGKTEVTLKNETFGRQ